VKAFAVARNVPVVEPAGIVSDAGTLRFVELELSATVPPPDPVRTTVQVLEAFCSKAPGLHTIELIALTAVATLAVPPVAGRTIELPVGDAPRLLVIETGASLLPERVTDTVAITPSEIAVEFNPQATHVYEFTPLVQDRVLPAEVRAGPPARVKVRTLAAG